MYKNIVIFNPSFLGDSVLTTPLIKAVKYHFPNSNTYFCVRPEYLELFEGIEYIDDVIAYDKRKKFRGLKGIFKFAEKLRSYNPDLIISAHKSIRSTMVINFTGAKKTIGFKESSLKFLYSETVHRNMELHEVERNLLLLKPLIDNFNLENIKKIAGKPDTYLDLQEYEQIKKLIDSKSENKKIIGIAPASVWKTKMWPTEYFSELINKLYESNIISIVFAAPNEKNIIEKMLKNINVPVIDLSTSLSLKTLTAAIKSVSILVSNDSGPLHIAVSQDVPIVAIFGPTVKDLGFFPYDTKSIVVENNDINCRPCGLHGGNECPEKHFKCMKDISVEEVYDNVIKILDREKN